MSIKNWPGGRISSTPPTPSGPFQNSTASGVWTLDQVAYWRSQNQWPIAGNVQPDPFFENVTMLLHGDGTNGAQNNTFLDSSTNNFTITRNGNTTQGSFSPYGPNWSNFFDGSGDYLLPTASTIANFGTSDFTVECWINVSALGNTLCIMDARDSSNTSQMLFQVENDNKVKFGTQATYFVASTTSVSVGVWMHVAVSRQSGTIRLYVNGSLEASASDSTNYTQGTNRPVIGVTGFAFGFNSFFGYISNLRIVKGTAVYTANFTPSTTPLTAISGTSLLTCADNRFIDDSTNNFTLTIGGTPSTQRFSPFQPTAAYSTATIGGSGYFDGSGDFLRPSSTNAAFDMGTGNYTLEAWVYPQSFSGVRGVYAWRGDAVLLLGVNPFNGQQDLSFYDGSFQYGGFNIALNQWVHIAFVRSSGTARFFVNGVAGNSFSMTQSQDAAFAPYIGSTVSNEHFLGYISNLRVVKGSALYSGNFTPPTAPLTAITNTSLLLNMVNGAIFDNAMMNDLETVGNAQISTSVVKFGTGSVYLTGASWLQAPANPSLSQPGDFTAEAWVYISSTFANSPQIFSLETDYWLKLGFNSARRLVVDQAAVGVLLTGATALATGQWYHVALTRSGNTVRVFVDGVVDGTATHTNRATGTAVLYLGKRSDAAVYFPGYLDDLRITNGVARYTANFTPPTAAFPDI